MGNIPIFRGKSDCGWVIGSHCYSPSTKEHYIIEHNEEELSFLVDEDTVSQGLSFYDVNGKMIFVGDFVMTERILYEIKFDYDEWWAFADDGEEKHFLSELAPLTIVGNVFENHELSKRLEDFVHDDKTFCGNYICDILECDRNPNNIRIKTIPHSFALFEGDKNICRKVKNH